MAAKRINQDECNYEDKNTKKLCRQKSLDCNRFSTFILICDKIANESSTLKKTAIVRSFLHSGVMSNGYNGNAYTFLKLLLPDAKTIERVYNLDSKQIIKLYSKIFNTDLVEMINHLNKGDVSDTCAYFFSKSTTAIKPVNDSTLSIFDIDNYLDKLTLVTKVDDQVKLLQEITGKFTVRDLVYFVRLVKKDLGIHAGAKCILDAISSSAYSAYLLGHDLKSIIEKTSNDVVRIKLSTPITPMLAEVCKSVEQAFGKCKNGVLSEIKYDGERLQLHKNKDMFNYYSRNLKPMQNHKVINLKDFIPYAFPHAKELILDGEVLLYDLKTQKPLPFGTLGVHKKNAFKDATVCLFVFDCLHLNGVDLTRKPLDERRRILDENMTEIPGRIMISKQTKIDNADQLHKQMMDVINEGGEGLVIKDAKGVYEPGKRHWLKMKKDYLDYGSMADTADLVVLGAYYGTGRNGGMRSVFLMGCFDKNTNKWYTVTKVGNGFDDKTLSDLQTKLEMFEVKNISKLPDWLVLNKTIMPDFVIKDPKKSPVWELTGAEFSKSDIHTADGISIRFPRVTKIRDDKTWKEATSLDRLRQLFALSKGKCDV